MITGFNIKDNQTLEKWVKQEGDYNYLPFQIWVKKNEGWVWKFYMGCDLTPLDSYEVATKYYQKVVLLCNGRVIKGGYND